MLNLLGRQQWLSSISHMVGALALLCINFSQSTHDDFDANDLNVATFERGQGQANKLVGR